MLDQELLEILVCPETHRPVRPADDGLLAEVNGAIEAGELTTVGGDPVKALLEAALVRDDRQRIYPVRDGIPIMLIDESIDWKPESGGAPGG